jgi:hypothetical protein
MKMDKDLLINILTAALEECQEYFDDRSDVVDGEDGQPSANEEMSMSRMIDAVLGKN